MPASSSAVPQTLPISTNYGSSTPAGLTPNQIRGAYGLGSYTAGTLSNGISFGGGIQGDGSGQTIAVVNAYDYPTALNDLNAFSTYYGLPNFNGTGDPTFEQLTQTGQPVSEVSGNANYVATDPAGPSSSDWEGEEATDIEWAHAMAPMANIVLFEAASATGTNASNLYTAVQTAAATPGVVVVSMSWSLPESTYTASQVSTYDSTVFTSPSGHVGGSAALGGAGLPGGVTFLAASGDYGPYGSSGSTTITPEYPATSPNVVAVGGTTLTVSGSSPNYTYGNETAWGSGTSTGTKGGGGGGISALEPQPSYQSGVVNSFSTTYRTYPDVSADANPTSGVPIYDSYDDGTSTPWSNNNGGTSIATPMWAGIIALADQGRALAGLGSLNGRTQTLPELYKLPAADFHDIASGSTGPSPTYSAAKGYDLATGIGSPVGNLLVPGLIDYLPMVTGISPAKGTALGGTIVTITGTDFTAATAVDFGKTAATNLSINAAGTQITATSPAEAVGTVDVTVVGPGGTSATSSADKFLYEPAVTAVSPISGPTTGGGMATVTGTGFAGTTAVDFGTTPATNVVVNSAGTQITATIPALPAGTVDVTVTGPDGTSPTSSADTFIALGVTAVTTTQPSGMYGAGTTIPIAVTFSEAVTVTGAPQLALNAGGGAVADYVSGSGTATLTFAYTVAAGQTTYDLDYSLDHGLGRQRGDDRGRDRHGGHVDAACDGHGRPGNAEHRHRAGIRQLRDGRFQRIALGADRFGRIAGQLDDRIEQRGRGQRERRRVGRDRRVEQQYAERDAHRAGRRIRLLALGLGRQRRVDLLHRQRAGRPMVRRVRRRALAAVVLLRQQRTAHIYLDLQPGRRDCQRRCLPGRRPIPARHDAGRRWHVGRQRPVHFRPRRQRGEHGPQRGPQRREPQLHHRRVQRLLVPGQRRQRRRNAHRQLPRAATPPCFTAAVADNSTIPARAMPFPRVEWP